MDIGLRLEQELEQAVAHAAGNDCPPLMAQALRHAVFPGGARIRPRLTLAVSKQLLPGRIWQYCCGLFTGSPIAVAPMGAAFGLGGTTAAKVATKLPVIQQAFEAGKKAVGLSGDFATRADQKLLQAMQRDGVSPADALDRLRQIKQSN